MRTASVIARYLAGVIFLVMGLKGFLNFIPLTSARGHCWTVHGRPVCLALPVGDLRVSGHGRCTSAGQPLRTWRVALLAPVIVNILYFHALMAPSGLPLALFVAVLWAVIFVDVRRAF
jgi:hypothetical protein